jgi:cytochrome c oxidase cbb3-type subunit 3
MSDFMHGFWPVFITAISLGGIFGCVLLLWFASKVKVTVADDGSNGHVWDGDLREMNNPMPMWWVGLFIITVIFGLAYLFLFPGLGSYTGKLGWSGVKQYESEVTKTNEKIAPIYAKYAAMSVEDLSKNEDAKGIGQRLFLNNCAQCHGSDARGSRGFPNLTDSDWLHGGDPEKIKETIVNGRIGMMPPMAGALGTEDDVKNVANYVLSISGSMHDSGRAGLGKAKFGVCAACHGADGKGNPAIGAPNLTDNIWLHGAGEAAIIKRIHEGKVNQMPAWSTKFTPEQIHVLTAYVWGLSNK